MATKNAARMEKNAALFIMVFMIGLAVFAQGGKEYAYEQNTEKGVLIAGAGLFICLLSFKFILEYGKVYENLNDGEKRRWKNGRWRLFAAGWTGTIVGFVLAAVGWLVLKAWEYL